MTALLAALSGALVTAGVLGVIAALRPRPVAPPTNPRRTAALRRRVRKIPTRTGVLALVGFGAGALVAVLSGWLVAVVAIPLAVVGLPSLFRSPAETAQIERLEAMAEWTRNLAGVLTVGVGLEQALVATLRSTPEPIKPEVSSLVARLES